MLPYQKKIQGDFDFTGNKYPKKFWDVFVKPK